MSGFWGTAPQWVSAAAALFGVGIALIASQAWRNTLHNKRGDDLLAAVFDLVGEVGAITEAIRRRASAETFGRRVDHLSSSFRELQKAYVIAQRSYALDDQMLLPVRSIILRTVEQINRIHHGDGSPDGPKHTSAERSFVNVDRETAKLRDYVLQSVRPAHRAGWVR